jgi:hypothetical protein
MSSDLIIDLSEYKDRMGNRVLPGNYRVVVEDAEPDQSKAGNPMVNLWFRVIGGDFDGATLVDRLVMTEKSLFRVVGFMQAIGMPTPRKRLKINIQAFIGKSLMVEVDDGEPYNGRVRSEVRGYMRVSGADKAESAEADDLEALMESESAAEPVKPEAAKEAALPKSTKVETESSDVDDTVDLADLDLEEIDL